jgi:hypothetical protein
MRRFELKELVRNVARVPIFSRAGVNKKPSEWARTCRYVIARIIDNGLGGLLIFGGIIVAIVWVMAHGMTSGDRKEVMVRVLGWPFFGILGWLVAFGILLICMYSHRARERTHEGEINRVAEVKNKVVQAALPFELTSSEEPPKQSN